MSNKSFNALVKEAATSAALAVEEAKIDYALALAKLLERGGLSRSTLAERLGVSAPMVTKILRGDTNLTIETMVKAAAAADGVLHINIADKSSTARWFEIVSGAAQRVAPPILSRPHDGDFNTWNQLEASNETESAAA